MKRKRNQQVLLKAKNVTSLCDKIETESEIIREVHFTVMILRHSSYWIKFSNIFIVGVNILQENSNKISSGIILKTF